MRDDFLHAQNLIDAVETTADLEDDQAEATVELCASFLAFVASKLHQNLEAVDARYSLLLNIFRYFTSEYLAVHDIHSLAAGYDTEVRKTVLSSYFNALAALRQHFDAAEIPHGPSSALLSAASNGKASIFALFGGQGTNEVYFDELQSLYDIYKPFVLPFLTTITTDVLIPLATSHQSSSTFYTHGLDILSWLSGSAPRPPTSYLASVPISFPLIGLTQLTQYLVVCQVTSNTPSSLRSLLAGATGHSQGIVSAVTIAASTSFESYTVNSIKALKWLFFSGLRGQQAFPVVALEPSIVKDSIEGGEGSPSPMLSVTGLLLKDLEPHLTQTNTYLPENSQLHVSLYNGPRAFVVTGPAKALYGLVTSLRKVKAPSGSDQSKTPFSQRKPVFSVRFLVVGVPYHSHHYLEGVTEKVEEDLSQEELWTAEELSIPVFGTEDGNKLVLSILSHLTDTLLVTQVKT